MFRTPLDGFDLDSDITISEIRHEETLASRLLAARGLLRLRRRSDTIGIVVDPKTWRAFEKYVRDLQARLEDLEHRALAAMVNERLETGTFVQGSAENAGETIQLYEAIIAKTTP